VTNENFEVVINNKNPIVIEFYASWSAPSKLVTNILYEISGMFEGKVRFARIEFHGNADMVKRLDVEGVPTVIILKSGIVAKRIIGLRPEEQYIHEIESCLQ
jgi:thioredoxin 1